MSKITYTNIVKTRKNLNIKKKTKREMEHSDRSTRRGDYTTEEDGLGGGNDLDGESPSTTRSPQSKVVLARILEIQNPWQRVRSTKNGRMIQLQARMKTLARIATRRKRDRQLCNLLRPQSKW